jgi:hypothetical protein
MNQIPKMRGIGAAGAHMVNALADPFLRMISAHTRSAFVEGKPVPNPLPKCRGRLFPDHALLLEAAPDHDGRVVLGAGAFHVEALVAQCDLVAA